MMIDKYKNKNKKIRKFKIIHDIKFFHYSSPVISKCILLFLDTCDMNSLIHIKKETLALKLFQFNCKHIAHYIDQTTAFDIVVRNNGIYLSMMNYKFLNRDLDKYYLMKIIMIFTSLLICSASLRKCSNILI